MKQKKENSEGIEKVSLFWAVFVFVLGVAFLLANLNVFSYRQLMRFWPIILILFGLKIFSNLFGKEDNDEAKQD